MLRWFGLATLAELEAERDKRVRAEAVAESAKRFGATMVERLADATTKHRDEIRHLQELHQANTETLLRHLAPLEPERKLPEGEALAQMTAEEIAATPVSTKVDMIRRDRAAARARLREESETQKAAREARLRELSEQERAEMNPRIDDRLGMVMEAGEANAPS